MVWRREDVIQKITEDKGERSLREYAKIVGTSAMYISDVLNNRRDPGPKLLDRFGLEKEVTRTVVYKPKKKWRRNE